MTDFYSVLTNALERTGASSESERDDIYAHVREVMVRQLNAFRPQLSQKAIEERIAAFDAAIRRIEFEVAHALPPPRPAEAEPPKLRVEAREVEPAVAEASRGPQPARPRPAQAPRLPEPPVKATPMWSAPAIDLAWDEAAGEWQDPAVSAPPTQPESEAQEAAAARPRPQLRSERPRRVEVGAGNADAIRARLRAKVRPEGSPAPPGAVEAVRAAIEPPVDGRARRASPQRLEPQRDGAAGRRVEARPPAVVVDDEARPAGDAPTRAGAPEVRRPRRDKSEGARLAAAAPAMPAADFRIGDAEIAAAANDGSDHVERRSPWRMAAWLVAAIALVAFGYAGFKYGPALIADLGIGEAAADTIIVYDGGDPMVFSGGNGSVRYQGGADGGFVRIASSLSGGMTRAAIGGAGVTGSLGGEITTVLTVRGTPGQAPQTVRVGYQRGNAILGWQTVTVPADFAEIRAEWSIPAGPASTADYLLIEPGIPGDGSAVDVSALALEMT